MQDAVALLIVSLAAGFLGFRAWQRLARRRAGACGSCQTCSANDSLKSKPLVTLTPIISHAEAQRRGETSS